ncbi:MAG: DUF2314 domain-containing protein, partial [Primorskyibacter sp.]
MPGWNKIGGVLFAQPLVWGCALGVVVALSPGWMTGVLTGWLGDLRGPDPSASVSAPAVPLVPQQVPQGDAANTSSRPRRIPPSETALETLRGGHTALADSEAHAIQAARRHLPRFLAAALDPPEHWQTVALRVEIALGAARESLWVEHITPTEDGGRLTGVLSFGARTLSDLPQGKRVFFAVRDIDDWGFVRDRRGYGYFTAHARLP